MIQNFVREYSRLRILESRSEEEREGGREGKRTNSRMPIAKLPTSTKCKCWLSMWAALQNIFL